MALSLKDLSFTNSARGVVGLDLDGSFMAAVQTSGERISGAVSTDVPAGLMADGEVSDVEALSRAIQAFFKANSLPRRVQLGVSNQQIVVRQFELPPIADEEERTAAVRFQAADAIAMPLEEAELDYHVVGEGPTPGGSTQMRVLVVAARKTMIARMLEAVRGAGLKPEGIDLSAFALVRMMASPDALPEDARVYCHLAGVTNLAVAQGSTCLFTRQLSAAWDGGRGGPRRRTRRGDSALHRLLHDAAQCSAGRQGHALGPRVDPGGSRRRAG